MRSSTDRALTELVERVKNATGPDREIDLALATALVPDVLVLRQRDDDSGADPYTYWRYTEKIDDAIALVERMMPDHRWGIHCHHSSGGEFRAHVTKNSPLRPMPNVADAPTAPLAILSALLAALSKAGSQ